MSIRPRGPPTLWGSYVAQKREHFYSARVCRVTAASKSLHDMQVYRVLANIQKFDPTHELAATISYAGMLYGYGVNCPIPPFIPND